MNSCFPDFRARRAPSTVPAYSASGRRVRNYSLSAVEALLGATPPRCSAKRSKTGRITSVQLFPLTSDHAAADEKTPLRKTIHLGQYYSFPQQVDEAGHRVWRHAPMLTPRSEEAELILQEVFRAVPLSCMESKAQSDPKPTPAKVLRMPNRRPCPPIAETDAIAA